MTTNDPLQRAIALHQRGRLAEAQGAYREILARAPDSFDALHLLGVATVQAGRAVEGAALIERAIALNPGFPSAHANLAAALDACGRRNDALAAYDRAIALADNHVDAHAGRADLLRKMGRLAEALASSDRALALQPDHAGAWSGRGNLLHALGRFDDAVACHDRAIALDPETPHAWSNRGTVLSDLGRQGEALESFDRALALDPNLADAHCSRGMALHAMGRFEEALACHARAQALRPGDPVAQLNDAMTHLILGRLEDGWRLYEGRTRVPDFIERTVGSAPPWPIAADPAGRTLLVQAEQGLGDTLQFCRFLPLLRERGARVVFAAQDEVAALVRGVDPAIEVIGCKTEPPAAEGHLFLMSLPHLLGSTLDSLPASVPYLQAEPARVARWRARIGDRGFRIGVCWQGSLRKADLGRSFPLAALAGLAQLPDVRLISLQKGHGLEQLAQLPGTMSVETLGDDFDAGPDAFLDSAAAMESLDLVISADTAMAHLAGALARPVWLALRHVADWRWLTARDDSPWYPTARLFRQPAAGDWTRVFAAMTEALARQRGISAVDLAPPSTFEEALAHHRAGRTDKARDAYAAFLRRAPRHFEALHLLGVACLQLGDPARAVAVLRQAIDVDPTVATVHSNLGYALETLDRLDEALASCDRAVALDPGQADVQANRANVLNRLGRHAEALAAAQRALDLQPDHGNAQACHANALLALGRDREALASFDRVVVLRPGDADAWRNRAGLQFRFGLAEDAPASISRALALHPDEPRTRFIGSLIALSSGRLDEGWRLYESRKVLPDFIDRRDYAVPELQAADDVAGKTILVHAEQGLGDTLQFCRFLPLLAARGARVVFAAQDSLVSLIGTLDPSVEVAGADAVPRRLDLHAYLMSLPGLLGTTLDSIPARVPYLSAQPDRVERWRRRIGSEGYRIGVCWQGSRRQADLGRSFPLTALAALAQLPGVRLISLQKGTGSEQLDRLPSGLKVESLGDDFDSGPQAFLDSAAVIEALDLVISADTAIAHLAGALGRPVWLALRHVPDWRWLRGRDDSPWYPTARLFRQAAAGDWDSVFAAMAAAIAKRASPVPPASRSFDALHTDGVMALQRGDDEHGVALLRRAAALRPDQAMAHSNLAYGLLRLGRREEALASADRAVQLGPSLPAAHSNRANVLAELGRLDEAVASQRRMLALQPDDPMGHLDAGIMLLSLGRLEEGLRHYEGRTRTGEFVAQPPPPAPAWTGAEDLNGRTILVRAEQGLGDTLQFCRYLPLLEGRGARVVFAAQPAVGALVRTVSPSVTVIGLDASPPPVDFHAWLMSLPLLCGTTLASIPAAVPYLRAEPARVARWRERLGGHGLKVGVCWQGSRRKADLGRSFPLAALAGLAARPGVRLISLQKGPGSEQLESLPAGMTVESLGETFDAGPDAFLDSAAVIECLDLVITCDTAIGHLAGALARPVWLALRFVPDWRWMRERADTPWYPTMRLFRQSVPGDWRSVFAAIADSLDRVREERFRTLNQQALAALREDRFGPGVDLLAQAIVFNPGAAVLHSNLAYGLERLGRHAEALASCDRALALDPGFADAHANRANVLIRLDRFDEALASSDRALARDPRHVSALLCRGSALGGLARFEEAVACFAQALALQPGRADLWRCHAEVLMSLKRPAEALASLDRASALQPSDPGVWFDRGNVLVALERFAPAAASFERATDLDRRHADAWCNGATMLYRLGRFDEALARYAAALAVRPEHPKAMLGEALVKLALGRLREGFARYEARKEIGEFRLRHGVRLPEWRGEEDPAGRSILVVGEQGLGDTIQFCRYLPLLAARGARVRFAGQSVLAELMRTLGPTVEIAGADAASDGFERFAHLLSLPFAFATDIDSIPARMPYLAAQPARVSAWRQRLGNAGFRIGVCWQANPANVDETGRSFAPAELAPLARLPGIRLIGLQKNPGSDLPEALAGGLAIESLGPDFDSGSDAFLDSAAVMQGLDLVITCDTAIAHLAGALGRPVWIALKAVPDWRWMLERPDSPWYPTAKLFRQTVPGDWKAVFATMTEALAALLAARGLDT